MSRVKNVRNMLKELAIVVSVMREQGKDGQMVELVPPSPQEWSSFKGQQLSPEGSKLMWASRGLASLAEGMEIHVLGFQAPQ